MTFIVLTATDSNEPYLKGNFSIEEQKYEQCYIFKRFEHVPKSQLKAEDVLIYKNYPISSSNSVALKPGLTHQTATLEKAHVYFSKMDDKHINPLVLVLFFNGDTNPGKKYYLRSAFERDISSKGSKEIDQLIKYTDEGSILQALFDENDGITTILTYLLDRTTEGYYNQGKITILKEDRTFPGFIRYNHIATGAGCKIKACVLYKKQVLLWLNNDKPVRRMVPITQIQNVNICSMAVYYSPNNSEPLFVEFVTESKTRRETSYYFRKTSISGFFWQILDGSSFKYLFGTSVGSNHIHTKLTSESNKLLLQALNKIDDYLVKVLILFVDKRDEYLGSEVNETLKRAELYTDGYIFANTSGKIKVNHISSDTCKSLSEKGYTVYEHDFNEISKTFKEDETVKIKFIKFNYQFIFEDNSILVINLDYQVDGGQYNSENCEIQVARSHNPKHKYVWYRYSSFKEIIGRTFILYFNGQSLTINGDLGASSYNQAVIVYFYSDYRDRFVLVAFPDKKFAKVWYMTYFEFKEKVLGGKPVRLSQLKTIVGNVKTDYETGGAGVKIDKPILEELQNVYKQLQSDAYGSIDSLLYQKGKDKFYVYTSADGSRVLMIFYNDRAYMRYFLGPNRSTWKPVDGVNKCVCSNKFDLKDDSNRKFFSYLSSIASLHRLTKPKKVTKEDESENSFTIDISKTGPANYESKSITVTKQTVYDMSNLFLYCTHDHASGTTFKISSLKAGSPYNKTIRLESPLKNVKSVKVYFSVIAPNKPIILEILMADLTKKYYTDLIEAEEDYTITEDPDISSRLCDQLFDENEKKNNTLAYQIDKTIDTGNNTRYGYNNSVTVTKEKNNGFTIYTHQPTRLTTNKAYVLYGKKILVGRSGTKIQDIDGIHNKIYNSINVYAYDNDEGLPLLIELKEQKTSWYSHKIDENGTYWTIEQDFTVLNIKSKIDVLFYLFKSSAIIEIDRGLDINRRSDLTYPIKLIENKVNGTGQSIVTNYNRGWELTKNITISIPSKINNRSTYTGFNYVNHEIKDSTFSYDEKKDISGFRLYLRQIGVSDPSEVKLYDRITGGSPQEKDRVYLYYSFRTEHQGKIVIYFYREDTRPLVICFNSKLYKRFNDRNDQWILVKGARCYNPSEILETLNSVYRGMKKKLTFSNQRNDQHIDRSTQLQSGPYNKDIYRPDFLRSSNGPYILTKSTLTLGISDPSILIKFLDSIITNQFDRVVKYYRDKSNPLLIEFRNDSSTVNFVRVDNVKHWIKESEKNLENQLEQIETDANKTIVYEIDQTSIGYNSNIKLKPELNKPSNDFDKYTHTPQGQNLNKCIILYNLDKLKKNGEPLSNIEGQTYQSVIVYFGKKAKDRSKAAPLILELTSTDNTKKRYKHRLKRSVSSWETMTIASTDSNDKYLIDKLKETELDMVESVVVLIEKTKGETYGDNEILNSIRKHDPPKEFNLANINPKSILVNDKDANEYRCISHIGYKVCEHDLSSCLKGARNYGIRFFILSSNSTDKYKELTLCNSEEFIDTLYYDKSALSGKDKVYVYFYAKDPRPLLACYNGIAYRPKSLEEYETKWVKVDKSIKCLCQNTEYNLQLIETLSQVVKFLNVVQLDKRPTLTNPEYENPDTKGMNNYQYKLQKFKNKDIEINVSYENKKCYRVYTYKHNGAGDNDDKSYRLGHIKYESNSKEVKPLNYTTSKPLLNVSTYYSLYDKDHIHPFLIVLRFRNGENTEEYYKLKGKNSKEWEKIDDIDDYSDILKNLKGEKTIEDGLYQLRKKLEIDFENKDKITPLFKADDCKEDVTDLATYVGAPLGTAAGVGAIVTIGVVVFKKLSATAVTTVAAAAAAAA